MRIGVSSTRPPGATLAVVVTDPARSGAREPRRVGRGDDEARHGARRPNSDGQRALVVGGGQLDEVDATCFATRQRAVVAEAAREYRRLDRIAARCGRCRCSWPRQARAIVEGAVLGGYEPGAWKTVTREGEEVSELVLVTDTDVSDEVRRAETAARWANRARDLVNRPANDLTPASFAEYATEVADGAGGLSAESLGPDEMRALGMGALLAVGAGSYNEPRLIVMRWEPPSPARKDILLGLVGKGMTFDSGGISLKPATNMEAMKGDMAGAAAVVAGIGALAELEMPVRAIAVVAAAENMPSGGASGLATSSPPPTARRSRSRTPMRRAASCSQTPSGTPESRARRTSSTSRR